jgi:maleate isomerase
MTRIGMLLTQDNAIDPELWAWCPDDVSLHTTRLQVPDYDILEDEAVEQGQRNDAVVQAATRTLVMIEPEVVVFGCTSSSFVNGYAAEAEIRESILAAGAKQALTTSGAVVAALRALGIRKVAVGAPYPAWLSERLRPFLSDAGFEVVSLVHESPDRLDMVSADEVTHLAESAYRLEADAIFLSCTAVDTRDLLMPLSERFGVPVVSAAQAMMWAALGMTGKQLKHPGHRLGEIAYLVEERVAVGAG